MRRLFITAALAFISGCSSNQKNIESEGVFNFKVCVKPDGKHYGISSDEKCSPPAKEAKSRPDTGFLNTKAGKGINYDTAKDQGDIKTREKSMIREANKAYTDTQKRGLSRGDGIDAAIEALESRFKLKDARDWLDRKGVLDKWYDKFKADREEMYRRVDEQAEERQAKIDKSNKIKVVESSLSSESGVKGGAALGALEDLGSS